MAGQLLASLQEFLHAQRLWLYPLIMLAALVAAWLICRRTQAALGLTPGQRWGLLLGAFCGAMIGSKLPFLLADWPGLVSGHAWLANGKTIVLGIVGGYFGVELAKWILGVTVKTGDSFALPVAVAVAIGRLGCFTAGCCYGATTSLPWGVEFPGVPGARHPTQLYETAFHLAAAAAIYALWKRGALRGQLLKAYIIAYLAYRFLSEFVRPEPTVFGLPLTGYQLAALALIPLFAWLWWRDARRMGEGGEGVGLSVARNS